MLRPTILNGSNNNHKSGNKNSMISAKGQHKTNRMQKRRMAMMVFIGGIKINTLSLAKKLPGSKRRIIKAYDDPAYFRIYNFEQYDERFCTLATLRVSFKIHASSADHRT